MTRGILMVEKSVDDSSKLRNDYLARTTAKGIDISLH